MIVSEILSSRIYKLSQMNPAKIREISIEKLSSFKIQTNSKLPLLDTYMKLRDETDIQNRLLCLEIAVACSHGFPKSKGITWLQNENLLDYMTKFESLFLLKDQVYPQFFIKQIEGMWALAWGLSLADHLDINKECDDNFVDVFPDIQKDEISIHFKNSCKLRSIEEIVSMCDLYYCLHWASRQAELEQKQLSLVLSSIDIKERRRALEWMLCDEEWDKVQLDT